MYKDSIEIIAVLAAISIAGLPPAHADSNDGLLAQYRMFQLENDDVQTVIRGQTTKAYRVCVEDSRHAVPLKVSYGAEEIVVAPGECQLIEASKIKMAAVGRMPDGVTMIGRFNNSSAKKYSTAISVARNEGK